jgi:hypothetical protein
MAWNPNTLGLLSTQYNGKAMIDLLQSLIRELAKMQQEIDQLKKVK